MNKYQKKKAALRKKGVKKERYFILSSENKWEFVEVSEAEAMRQTDVVLWEEEEPGEQWAVYRGDLLI